MTRYLLLSTLAAGLALHAGRAAAAAVDASSLLRPEEAVSRPALRLAQSQPGVPALGEEEGGFRRGGRGFGRGGRGGGRGGRGGGGRGEVVDPNYIPTVRGAGPDERGGGPGGFGK